MLNFTVCICQTPCIAFQ